MTGKPPWIKDSVGEALEEYGFVPWMTMENVEARRELNDYTTALLFKDRDGNFEGKYFVTIISYSHPDDGYEVTEEGAGPVESVEEFRSLEPIQTLF